MRVKTSELAIKVKSLAAEGSIIRHAEQRAKRSARLAETRILVLDGAKLSHWRKRLLDTCGGDGSIMVVTPRTNGIAERAIEEAKDDLAVFEPIRPRATKEALVNRATHHRDVFNSLRSHRKNTVGHESRIAQLAYAFLRGRAYSQVEQANTRERPPWQAVYDTVRRFGGEEAAKGYAEWAENAVEHLRAGHDQNHPPARLAPWRP